MATPLMWNALDRCERYFLFYWNCPFFWNSKAGKAEYKEKLWTLKGWVIIQFLTISNLSVLVGCLGVCHFSKSCLFSLTELIIIGISTALAILTISYDILMLLYGEDESLVFNWMKQIHSLMIKRKFWGQGQKKLDLVGMLYLGIAIMFAVYPYFITFFGIIIYNVDPLYFAAKQLQLIPFFHSHFFIHFTFVLMRVSLTFPAIVQACRLFSSLVIFTGILLSLITDAVRMLQSGAAGISLEWKAQKILQTHATLEIIAKMALPFARPIILVSMGTGLVSDVLFNYATLKLHGTIPMPFYLYFPSVSIIIPIVVQLLLPVVGVIVEADKKLHQEWAYHTKNCRNKGYLRRKLKGVATLKTYAGLPGSNIFPVDSSTKGTYYRAMVDYTITALLWNQ